MVDILQSKDQGLILECDTFNFLHVEFGGEEGFIALGVAHGLFVDGKDLYGRCVTFWKL